MDTLDMLEEILSRYDGTLLVVSHDRDFLDQTVSKILAFEGDGKIEGYIGGYGDYVQSRKAELIKMSGKSATRKGLDKKPQNIVKENPKPLGQLSYKLKYELEKLPERISALENEIRELESALSDCNLYERDAVKFQEFSRRLKTAADELASAEARWLELDEMNSVI
jgi:ATP-binding cassette subfamily F protein uup